jgi:hypothetical protein
MEFSAAKNERLFTRVYLKISATHTRSRNSRPSRPSGRTSSTTMTNASVFLNWTRETGSATTRIEEARRLHDAVAEAARQPVDDVREPLAPEDVLAASSMIPVTVPIIWDGLPADTIVVIEGTHDYRVQGFLVSDIDTSPPRLTLTAPRFVPHDVLQFGRMIAALARWGGGAAGPHRRGLSRSGCGCRG